MFISAGYAKSLNPGLTIHNASLLFEGWATNLSRGKLSDTVMFRSLRNRLILSHILPALIIIPLMGAAMVFVLEPRLLLPTIYKNLAKEATLMAEITRNQSAFWQDAEIAQALVDGVDPYLSGRLSLVALDG